MKYGYYCRKINSGQETSTLQIENSPLRHKIYLYHILLKAKELGSNKDIHKFYPYYIYLYNK